jgi:hypothetical protein
MLRRVDRSKVTGLFNTGVSADNFDKVYKENYKKSKGNSKEKKVSDSKQKFLSKLEDGLFNDFKKADWLHYFQHKASEHGVNYIVGNYIIDYAILGSLMERFTSGDMKLMIDFLFDCEHDIEQKRLIGVTMLSKGWINTIYQSALMWKDGEYKTRKQLRGEHPNPHRNREWVSDKNDSAVASPKSKIRF